MRDKKVSKVGKVSKVSKANYSRDTRDTRGTCSPGEALAKRGGTFSFGFTFVELLVVISIIGILTSLLLASFTTVQQQARNIQRKNDLKQYLTALENYASVNNSLYPSRRRIFTPNLFETRLCNDLAQFLSGSCPQDPRDVSRVPSSGQSSYKYYSVVNGSGEATSLKAGLSALLEGGSVSGSGRGLWWVVCTNGKSETVEGDRSNLGGALAITNTCF